MCRSLRIRRRLFRSLPRQPEPRSLASAERARQRRSHSNPTIRANLGFRRIPEAPMRAYLLVVMTAGVGLLSGTADSNARCSGSAYALLRRDFHEAVRYLPAEHAIEFCPDNTCHQFVSRRVSCDGLAEFLLVYLRYYSDYVVLEDWRKRDDVQHAV